MGTAQTVFIKEAGRFSGLVSSSRWFFVFVCLLLPDSLYSCQSSSINITEVLVFMLR